MKDRVELAAGGFQNMAGAGRDAVAVRIVETVRLESLGGEPVDIAGLARRGEDPPAAPVHDPRRGLADAR